MSLLERRIPLKISFIFSLLLTMLLIQPAQAQDSEQGACPTIVNQVLQSVDNICSDTGRNQACYGNLAVEVVAREDITFANVGDIADVAAIESLRMSPLDEASEAWGVTLMRLQANLPNTLPGQNVTFVLYGDVEITNAVSANNTSATPMQAFYLQTGVGESQCAEAPDSGLLVQTPEGVGEVTFSVNGVDISVGSTVFLQAQPNRSMSVSAVEGAAVIEYEGEAYQIIAGTQRNIPLDEDLLPIDIPDLLLSYEYEDFENLPLEWLERDIDIEIPLDEDRLEIVYGLIDEGVALCDMYDYLPDCDSIPFRLGGEACQLNDDGDFNCEVLRDFSWGEDGFGDFEYEELWEDFEFDYDAIGMQGFLDDYGIESLDELFGDLPDAVWNNLDFDDMSLDELQAMLDQFDIDLEGFEFDDFDDFDDEEFDDFDDDDFDDFDDEEFDDFDDFDDEDFDDEDFDDEDF